MRLFFSIILALWGLAAHADNLDPSLPALYAVTGVAADDSLNVRAGPRGGDDIVGTLAPDKDGLEVVALSREGNWALLNYGEGAGWVSMRFLTPQPMATTVLGLPVGLQCFGTEPFWDITFFDEMNLILNTPDSETTHAITANAPAPEFVNLAETGFSFAWRNDRNIVSAHILPGACSDGMSDRRYGLHYVDDQGLRRGCCSLN
ncbi:SH3 domain-containing protein [Loktanella sp. Alg231-35]|uniref:SH3 domain-containing protein n=1 Tax=Loktanella sp. Alg231-35 TaxID=1922220 RepID=UPI00131F19F4|nr:SH3 domain-containing protein [Loktanella sp. Alg231-35]